MDVTPVHAPDGSLLRAVRAALHEAEEAVLAVAYINDTGVHLIEKELERLGHRARVVTTTAFGTTTPTALARVRRRGAQLRLFNPAQRSYHPKLYLGRRRDGSAQAVIGSGNLTGGLVHNVELGLQLRGRADEGALAETWAWAEALWADPALQRYRPPETLGEGPPVDAFPPALFAALQAAVAMNPVFLTLGAKPSPNTVTELAPSGVWVQTPRSAARGRGSEFIPAWMFTLAWEALQARGTLSNTQLLNELRVHRSSGVCAVLARLPQVRLLSRHPITLGWDAPAE